MKTFKWIKIILLSVLLALITSAFLFYTKANKAEILFDRGVRLCLDCPSSAVDYGWPLRAYSDIHGGLAASVVRNSFIFYNFLIYTIGFFILLSIVAIITHRKK